jgi:hypothetical protein
VVRVVSPLKENAMTKLTAATAALILVLASAACGPTDSIPPAQAQAPAASAVLYPEVQGAADGQVYEYH